VNYYVTLRTDVMTFVVVAATSCLVDFRLCGRKWTGHWVCLFFADVDTAGIVKPIDISEQRWTGIEGRLASVVSCEWRMSRVLLLITITFDNDVMGCHVFGVIA